MNSEVESTFSYYIGRSNLDNYLIEMDQHWFVQFTSCHIDCNLYLETIQTLIINLINPYYSNFCSNIDILV